MNAEHPPPRRVRRGSGAVTLHDVARLAGVAPITASRALNSPDKVSAEALKKVTDAVEKTGYVPNRLAGGLASARSRLVAAVVPTLSGPVFLETVQSLTTVRIDGTAIGRQAAQFIVARAEGRPVAQRVVDLGFTIVERDSV